MHNTSVAHRIVKKLSSEACVTILDQTGEYRTKRSISPQGKDRDMSSPGIAVFEPEPGKIAPDIAFQCIDRVFNIARAEYHNKTPFPRSFLINDISENGYPFWPFTGSLL